MARVGDEALDEQLGDSDEADDDEDVSLWLVLLLLLLLCCLDTLDADEAPFEDEC